jgi:prepilin-type N-terminal cleavage/methylation domain-containing protein
MKSHERGFSLIELLIVVGVISVLSSVALPVLMRARISGNEASAIGSLRTIVSAQGDYLALNRGYGNSLATLATTCAAVTTPFVSSDLDTNGVYKSGYLFAVVPGAGAVAGPNDACGTPVSSGFYATARAETVGTSGNRGFAADANMAIWEDVTGALPGQPFATSPTVTPLGR